MRTLGIVAILLGLLNTNCSRDCKDCTPIPTSPTPVPPPPAASLCTYALVPQTQNFSSSQEGNGAVGVGALKDSGRGNADECLWMAVSNTPWIRIDSGSIASGNRSFNYTVLANTGSSRTGTITVSERNSSNQPISKVGDVTIAQVGR